MKRIVMCANDLPEGDIKDFEMFPVKNGESDEDAIKRAKVVYAGYLMKDLFTNANNKCSFYIKKESIEDKISSFLNEDKPPKMIDNYRGFRIWKNKLNHDRIQYKASRAGVELSADTIELLKSIINLKIYDNEEGQKKLT
jgi:hypothetical protein